MDRTELEARIAELEAEIEVVRREMEPPCRQFLDATTRLAATWFHQHVEQTVLGKPEVTTTLSRDALSGLKADLKKLVERAPDLVEAHLNREHHWPHRRPVLNDSTTLLNLAANPYEHRPGHPPAALNAAIQDVLLVAQNLLDRYGFGPPARRIDALPTRPRRTVTFEWTEEMIQALAGYASHFERLKHLNSEVLPLRRRRGDTDTDARRLWDQA